MRIKYLLFNLGLLLTLISCTVTDKPEFIKVNSLDLIDASLNNFKIKANLQFRNTNSVGGVLQVNDVHVFIDSIDVATIQVTEFKVPKKSEFNIPLEATIPFSKVFNNNKQELLEDIMNVISSKKVNVQYKGEIRYKLGAFHYDYPLDYKQVLKLKK